MTKINTYTITATTMIASSNGAGSIQYTATDAPPTVTPDSQGEWCKVKEVVESMLEQGTELAQLRLQVADQANTIEDMRIEMNILNSIIDDFEREF